VEGGRESWPGVRFLVLRGYIMRNHRFPLAELVTRIQYDSTTHGRNAHAVKLLNGELHARGPVPAKELHQRLRSVTRSQRQSGKRG
jgi:hypothetical protein